MIPSHTSASRYAWLTDDDLRIAMTTSRPRDTFKPPAPPLNVDLLLASGVIEGPARPTRPITISRWMRIKRAISAYLNSRKFNP